MRPVATLLLCGACTGVSGGAGGSSALLVPGPPEPLGPAEAVGAADLDGDGSDTVITIVDGTATWGERTAELGGRVQGVTRGDIDGDGREELLVATGMGRGARDAPARIHVLDELGAKLLWERAGERAQVTDLAVVEGRVWVAAFTDRWNVEAGWLEDGGLQSVGTVRMGMQQRPLPSGAVAVGRLYGEEPRSDGDLRIRTPDGERVLPSHRGVRALTVADLGGPDGAELIVGDGWHHRYGTDGDPRVALLSGPAFEETRTIAWLDGDYAARAFEVEGAGDRARVLVTGARGVTLLQRDALGWGAASVGAVGETGNAVFVRDGTELAVAISGSPAVLVPLSEVR